MAADKYDITIPKNHIKYLLHETIKKWFEIKNNNKNIFKVYKTYFQTNYISLLFF